MSTEPRTSREWLLARHAAAEPKLDELRRAAIDSLANRRSFASSGPAPAPVLHALFGRHRHFWASLAAVWLLLLALQYWFGRVPRSQTDRVPSVAVAAWIDQLKNHESFAQVDRPR